MWECEHIAETSASPDEVWRHWSDLAKWPQWNDGIEKMQIDGPFAAGTTFTMTPPGDEPIRMRLTEITHGELFTDEMDGGDFTVRTVHRLEPAADGRTRIIYRTEIPARLPTRSDLSSARRSPPTSPTSSPPWRSSRKARRATRPGG